MSRYQFSDHKDLNQERREINPVMRGIGCIMMIIVPIFSYLLSDQLAEKNFGIQVLPASWYDTITFPPAFYQLSGPVTSLFRSISGVKHLAANLLMTVVITIVLGGIMSVVYGYIYQVFGPPKYGPTDEPPIRKKVKRYKR